eukprot:TRINITY_DN7094_c0_g1_i1.p1 TRINITY_DN7094_c0_g1~~TRINITY_DN7094_c0_g1_i1.p1  ORF type:complete len:341 (+),score=62.57 TRINITY_DN7094_c0_g1_i1:1-1023(+)
MDYLKRVIEIIYPEMLDDDQPIWFLGSPIDKQQFLQSYAKVVWFSYRRRFKPIVDNNQEKCLRTDRNWGCMLRCGQMLLAAAYRRHLSQQYLDWDQDKILAKIIKWFYDSPKAYLSVHQIVYKGESIGNPVGQWFSPSAICWSLQLCVNNSPKYTGLKVYTARDSIIYLDELSEILSVESIDENWNTSVLFLIPCRLGLKKLNPIYLDSLFEYLSFPSSMGFIGGEPQSAYYFVARQGKSFFYLDPHTTQSIVKLHDGHFPMDSYFPKEMNRMRVKELDESLALGFYVHNKLEYDEFVERCGNLPDNIDSLFHFEEYTPVESGHNSISLNQEGDDFNMDM